MNQPDLDSHDSFKPRWGPRDTIVCAKNDMTGPIASAKNRWQECFSVFSEGRDIAVLENIRPVQVCVLGLGLIVAYTDLPLVQGDS